MSVQRNRRRIIRWVAAMIVAIAALGSITKMAQASIITYWWTSWQGHGFIAYTAASRPVYLSIDSDAYGFASYSTYAYDVTSLELNQWVNCSGGTVVVGSQHSATDFATSESDWQESQGSGTCQ